MTETQLLKWQDVTITNNFMFSKIMSDKSLCKQFLEVMMEIRIDHLEEVSTEATRKVDPYSKAVRFDVYVKDSTRIFDVEMQMSDTLEIPKRSRYYQSVCDMDSLEAGQYYSDLKESYVIFICPFDLFGLGLPCYTFENLCLENKAIHLEDKTHKIFYNFTAYQRELNKNRRSVLQYFAEGKPEGQLAKQLDRKLEEAKVNVKWRAEYMTLEMELIGREKVGLEKGHQLGLNEGIEIGTARGIARGEEKKAQETAKRMLAANMPIPQIAQFTGLKIEEIETLNR